MSDLEFDLDPEQKAAVEAPERAIAVLAGPGSGKTRVLSYRAACLLEKEAGSSALLLTFTNKAAAEMKSRALGVASVASDRVQSHTYHSFCMRLLRAHGQLVGITPGFELMDDAAQAQFAQQVALSAGTHNQLQEWSKKRVRRILPSRSVAEFGSVYQDRKREKGLLDFDDLLVMAAELLTQAPEIATAYGTKFRHLLIDEFQDTNAVQFEVIRALAANASTISVFADDDQAIFSFAGAEVGNISRYCAELEARVYPLTINYRCREEIVERANGLILADQHSSGRVMRANRGGGEVRLLQFESMEDEARAVVREIEKAIQSHAPPESIAILVRSGFRAQVFLRLAEAAGLPVTNWLARSGDAGPRRRLRTCLAVVRSELSESQLNELCRLFQVSAVGLRKTEEFLESHGQTHYWALELLRLHQLALANSPALLVVEAAQRAVGAISVSYSQELQAFVDRTAEMQQEDPDYSLDHLLAELALIGSSLAPTEEEGIKVASLHRTKGLQWSRVYLLGLESGHIPDYRSTSEQEMREERRLCFVGVCRAEEQLSLTYVKRHGQWAKHPSPFLNDMKLIAGRS